MIQRRKGQRISQKTAIKLTGKMMKVALAVGLVVAMVSLPILSTTVIGGMQDHSSSPAAKVTVMNNAAKKTLVECYVKMPHHDDNNDLKGIIQITVRHDLSPIASAVFVDLVQSQHFDNVFIFRVLKDFVAQWGVPTGNNNNPKNKTTKPPKTKDNVHNMTLSNVRGTLSFAGGNPATEQVFVNLGNNQRLDQENSRPFASVSDTSMTEVLDRLYTGYKDGQGQIKALKQGEQAVLEEFPHMSKVEKCRIVAKFSST